MGTVRRLAPAAGDVTLGQAADAYLVTLGGAEQVSTRRTYGRILRGAGKNGVRNRVKASSLLNTASRQGAMRGAGKSRATNRL